MYANVDVKSVIVIAGVCRHIWRCPPVHGRQNDQKVPTVQSTWYAIAIEQVTRSNSCDYYSPHFVFCCALCLRCSVHAPSAAVRPANFVTHTHTTLSHTHARLYHMTSTLLLRGKRGTYGTKWQAWHWVTSTSLLFGRRGIWCHRFYFVWEAWQLVARTSLLGGRCGTWWHWRCFCVAGAALVALGRVWRGAFSQNSAQRVWGGALHTTLSPKALSHKTLSRNSFTHKCQHTTLSRTQHCHTHTHNSFTYNTFTCNSFTQDSVAHNSFRLFHKQLLCI